MPADNFTLKKTLLAFVFSVNFIFLCSYCTALATLGDSGCQADTDCPKNAYCINGHCICHRKYVQDLASHTCLSISKKINDSCKIDLQCTSSFGNHAFCFKNLNTETGQCKCMRKTHFQDRICHESVSLGGVCKVSDNCVSASSVPTYCVHSICVCAADHHPTDDRLDCLPDIGLGQKCTKDEECIAENSYCSEVCRCLGGYAAESKNKTYCLPGAKLLREPCEEDSECLLYMPNTFCDSQENNCKCLPNSHELDKTCWISAKLGEECSHPNQCFTASMNRSVVMCSQGMCSCEAGYRRQRSDCVRSKDATADSSKAEQFAFFIIAVVLLSLPSDYTIWY